jgi:hypothetical protein
MGLFTDLFSDQPAKDAAAAKAAGFQQGNTAAQSAITAGQATAARCTGKPMRRSVASSVRPGAGSTAYGNATGANGQAGIDSATVQFKSMPGYQGGLDTGINQLERRAAARGDLGGGNTSADTIKFASDYDAGKYGNYVAGLAPYLGASQAAAAGGAGVLGAQASGAQTAAGQQAQYGYNSATGVGSANADAALAPYQASQNFWSALTGVGGLALKASGIGGFAAPTKAAA